MNVAIIIAGGVGSRTGNRIPKQFNLGRRSRAANEKFWDAQTIS